MQPSADNPATGDARVERRLESLTDIGLRNGSSQAFDSTGG